MSTLRLHSDSAAGEREHVSNMLKDYGHWAIYRRYDLDKPSEFVDDATGEGVGGPKYEYDDIPILIRHDPASVRAIAGVVTEKSKIYVDGAVSPKRGDVIIEIDYDGENRELTPGLIMQMNHREVYEIAEMDYKRGQGGALIFSVCIVAPQLGEY